MNPYESPNHPGHGPHPGGPYPGGAYPGRVPPIHPEQAAALARELKRLNTMSFVLGVPGILLQGAGQNMGGAIGAIVTLGGTAMLVVGLVFYAKLRGRHPAFALLGLLSCLGLLILYFIPKSCLHCKTSSSFSARQCPACGAPLGS
ncbi:MAG: hypothetical protein HOW73_00520 [Polyangiaceae bacterium]|nr:hypothetical protein [Polyangiaceae bacterium]